MAQPSSSHHGERHHRSERERERERSERHHHHRTISSTTLLLVLSLVLAVLAVMLSLPSSQAGASGDGASTGVLSYLTPKRTQALIAREHAVAQREAEVARREAELLVGAPGGVIPSPSAVACAPCVASTTIETVVGPVQTVIKEIVKEDSLVPPNWVTTRAEEILDRELKIAEREREISKREESVNRREHDASRRESWIMEQLQVLGNDFPQTVEDEYTYEPVGAPKRKAVPKYHHEIPPVVVSEVSYETVTQTITVPPPANTRLAHNPKPEGVTSPSTPASPRTTEVEVYADEGEEEEPTPRQVVRRARPTQRPPSRWFGGW